MYPVRWSLIVLLIVSRFQLSISIDTITPNNTLKDIDGDVLVSSGEVFVLGFFSPVRNSGSRYVGIWFNQDPGTVVWVANRDHPINDTSGFLTIEGQGNLVLYQRNQTVPLWSTNVSVTATGNIMAQLLDSGNLVLDYIDSDNGPLWQSFDDPTNTQLPHAKLGLDYRTGLNRILTSWKSVDDPGTGTWQFRIDTTGFPQMFLYQGSVPKWRSGPWIEGKFSGIPKTAQGVTTSYVNDENETFVTYSMNDARSVMVRTVVNESGFAQGFTWDGQDRKWFQSWFAPSETCDNYGRCGVDSICDPYYEDKFECTCLPGFEPKFSQKWSQRDGSDGCVRNSGLSMCNNGEGFVRVARVKLPDTSMAIVDMSLSLEACGQNCLKNCFCVAYAYVNVDEGNGGTTRCLMWHGNLMDTRTYLNLGEDLYVRVDSAELARYAKNGSLGEQWLIAIIVASVVAIIVLVTLVLWLMKKKRRGKRNSKSTFRFGTGSSNCPDDSATEMELEGCQRDIDLPLFDLTTIAIATDNFSLENKLGAGGFGPVYKGVLCDKTEIAVKRLSKQSCQGVEEFKNEIALLAKLQHRNLVRILGCCIAKDEKMLIYEYMTNKSLDSFIFDETKRLPLNWEKRFEIIYGIARGMAYLHHDSRLRIIHRDLKASNVLLDSEMNPKISDFGMARIFGGDQVQGSTNRVVGTFGYMSPEYAMGGLFSIKSDTYSFGVLLLEIIAGGRNTGYYPDSPNLVGRVWDLWIENTGIEIIDPLMKESCSANEVLRCIQIGLLCVQEQATDRPTMAGVVGMLTTDTSLPYPKRPAFVVNRVSSNHGESTRSSEGLISVNEITVTMLHGR